MDSKPKAVWFVVGKYEQDAIQKQSKAFQECFGCWMKHDNIKDGHQFVKGEDEVLSWPREQITKLDVFVLDSFEGPVFEKLHDTEALVLGPTVIPHCLFLDSSIPRGPNVIFTISMREMVVTVSGVGASKKLELKRLINFMAGKFSSDLVTNCTHLVSNTVCSAKYEKAAPQGLQIMHPDWVTEVWERGKSEFILADHSDFDKHKLPVFYNLHFTSTNLSKAKREEVKKLIEDNGGTYLGAFQSEKINVLIVERDNTDSEKFRSAVTFKTTCLTPDWVRDSVKAGYSLAFSKYKVSSVKKSTPTKGHQSALFDITAVSEISHVNGPRSRPNFVDETARTSLLSATSFTEKDAKYRKSLDAIDFARVKRAGAFLDGCKIYLSGFRADDKEKLVKILNSGGATRYDELNDQTTHVVVGEHCPSDFATMASKRVSPTAVTIEWIVESIAKKEPADEEPFRYRHESLAQASKTPVPVVEPEQPSPASKKAIQSLNSSFKRPAVPPKFDLGAAPKAGPSKALPEDPEPLPLEPQDKENELFNQYLTAHEAKTPAPISATAPFYDETEMDTEDLKSLNFLQGKTVFLYGFPEEEMETLRDDCVVAKGTVVDASFVSEVDFVLVPVSLKEMRVPVRYKDLVNDLWLEASIQQNQCVEKQYWHEPIVFGADEVKPLSSSDRVCLSTYAGQERMYLQAIAEILGADSRDTLQKKEAPILICPEPEGSKYQAAKKWKLSTVTKDWLLACLKERKRVDLEDFTVGLVRERTVDELPPALAPSATTDQIDLQATENTNTIAEFQNFVTEVEKFSQDMREDLAKKSPLPNEEELVIRHRRLQELKRTSTPELSPYSKERRRISENVNELVPTPNRSYVKGVLLEALNKETPGTRRAKELMKTPGAARLDDTVETPKLPECMQDPGSAYDFGGEKNSPRTRRSIKRRLEVLEEFLIPGLYEAHVKSQKTDQTPPGKADLEKPSTSAVEAITETPRTTRSSGLKKLEEFAKNIRSSASKEKPKGILETDTEMHEFQKNQAKPESQSFEIQWRSRGLQQEDAQQEKRFIFTGIDETKKRKLAQVIESLGGKALQANSYDPQCTHVVCEKPSRNEKVVGGIASGKWIVSDEFVEASGRAGKFLDEESFEWGNSLFKPKMKLSEIEVAMADAAHRWRERLSGEEIGKNGAFAGFRCILHTDRKSAFTNIIKGGLGVVLDVSPPYRRSKEALSATHVLVDARAERPIDEDDRKAFKKAKIPVLQIHFLNHFLTSNSADSSIDRFEA